LKMPGAHSLHALMASDSSCAINVARRQLRATRIGESRGDTNDTKSSTRDIPTIPMRFRLRIDAAVKINRHREALPCCILLNTYLRSGGPILSGKQVARTVRRQSIAQRQLLPKSTPLRTGSPPFQS